MHTSLKLSHFICEFCKPALMVSFCKPNAHGQINQWSWRRRKETNGIESWQPPSEGQLFSMRIYNLPIESWLLLSPFFLFSFVYCQTIIIAAICHDTNGKKISTYHKIWNTSKIVANHVFEKSYFILVKFIAFSREKIAWANRMWNTDENGRNKRNRK